MATLLWFRRDLRLGDLPALLDAAGPDRGDVLACYVLDPKLATAGARRLAFLYDSLRALRDQLDGRLLVTTGPPDKRIPAIVKAINATSVHVSGDYSPFGRRRDEAVAAALGDVPLEAVGSPYLVSPGRVTKSDDTAYKVFTPFFRQWREHGWRAPASSSETSARWIAPSEASGANQLPDPAVNLDIPAGEESARQAWSAFVDDGLRDYRSARDRPDLDATSRMSAHLKFGTIHPRTMARDLEASDHAEGASTYLRELAFRDFYADVLFHWPASAWRNWNANFDAIETDTDADAYRRFDAWREGRTGFPIVDAGMRQLRETGFMHNRVRMIVASFLVKDLHLPWQWGARWFLDQLVDGDMASNQHGWQWAAGCGTDAAPYFRVFNPTAQGEKFDPSGEYIRRWIPELNGKGDDPKGTYPEAMVEHREERAEALRRYEATR